MKKVLLLFIVWFMAMTAMAQNEQHLKFMNIPLTGKISDFQWYLKKRGFKLDAKYDDTRKYTGKFAGEDAILYIYFNSQTKIVYKAKVVLPYFTEEIADRHYKDLENKLREKYSTGKFEEGQKDGKPGLSIMVRDDLFYVGYISIYNFYNGYDSKKYMIHIDYEDYYNSVFDDLRKRDDL